MKDECNFGDKCWYVHSQESKLVSSKDSKQFTCNVCELAFKTNSDLMTHKKIHYSKIPCQKFIHGECTRDVDTCWYQHKTPISSDFHEAPNQPFPPDQLMKVMEIMEELCLKVKKLETGNLQN